MTSAWYCHKWWQRVIVGLVSSHIVILSLSRWHHAASLPQILQVQIWKKIINTTFNLHSHGIVIITAAILWLCKVCCANLKPGIAWVTDFTAPCSACFHPPMNFSYNTNTTHSPMIPSSGVQCTQSPPFKFNAPFEQCIYTAPRGHLPMLHAHCMHVIHRMYTLWYTDRANYRVYSVHIVSYVHTV